MIRVLTISKPYVAKAYRKKLVDLAADGRFEIGLVCPLQWANQRYEGEPEAKVKTWRLPISFNGQNHLHFYLGLEDVFREFRPDIVNVEEEHYSLVTWQCFRLAKKYGAKPIFYTWQNISKKYPPPFSWIEQYIFRNAAAGIAGNSEAIDILHDKGFKGPCHEIVQMGVDMSQFTPGDFRDSYKRNLRDRLGLKREAFWVSFFGRLVPEKGLDVLLSAVTELKLEGTNICLLIAGDGPERERIQKFIQENKLHDIVTMKSQIPSTQVAQWLQAMDVLCLPSLTKANWKEQYGRILAEAMAAGTVVVGSSSGEIPKVIGKAGLVTQEGDAHALKGALRKLIQGPTHWKELQQLARSRVEERFSDQVVAEKFADVFASVGK